MMTMFLQTMNRFRVKMSSMTDAVNLSGEQMSEAQEDEIGRAHV